MTPEGEDLVVKAMEIAIKEAFKNGADKALKLVAERLQALKYTRSSGDSGWTLDEIIVHNEAIDGASKIVHDLSGYEILKSLVAEGGAL